MNFTIKNYRKDRKKIKYYIQVLIIFIGDKNTLLNYFIIFAWQAKPYNQSNHIGIEIV
jgi:hypothetical protein